MHDDDQALPGDDPDMDESDDLEASPSKSARKREVHALTDFGARLVQLPAAELQRVTLPEPLASAVTEGRRIRKHGARKRQIQFIGKLLRRMDAVQVSALMAAVEQVQAPGRAERQRFHALERWRDALLAGDDDALQAFVEAHPGADRQQLRQLIRNARRETQANRPPAAARSLFRYIRELDAMHGDGGGDGQSTGDPG